MATDNKITASKNNPDIPREIEVKIIRRVPPTLKDFEILMKRVGAARIAARRLLNDKRYRLRQSVRCALAIAPGIFYNWPTARLAWQYLGLDVIEKKGSALLISDGQTLLPRSVRLRRDGHHLWWTVKESSQNISGQRPSIGDRGEIEVEIKTFVPIVEVLTRLGYALVSEREKFRTTYLLGRALIEWQESPAKEVPPWMEVEAPSRKEVIATVRQLGFTKTDTAAIPDAEYLARYGVRGARAKKLYFKD